MASSTGTVTVGAAAASIYAALCHDIRLELIAHLKGLPYDQASLKKVAEAHRRVIRKMPGGADMIQVRLDIVSEICKEFRSSMPKMDLASLKIMAEFTFEAQQEIIAKSQKQPFTLEGFHHAVEDYKTDLASTVSTPAASVLMAVCVNEIAEKLGEQMGLH